MNQTPLQDDIVAELAKGPASIHRITLGVRSTRVCVRRAVKKLIDKGSVRRSSQHAQGVCRVPVFELVRGES